VIIKYIRKEKTSIFKSHSNICPVYDYNINFKEIKLSKKSYKIKDLGKAEFTHPVSELVFHIALRFFITYLGFDQSRQVIKNCNAMQKRRVETVCVNSA